MVNVLFTPDFCHFGQHPQVKNVNLQIQNTSIGLENVDTLQFSQFKVENMAWIQIIKESAAVGQLAKLYKHFFDKSWGGVDHILAIHSLNPRSMKAHYDLYATLMRGRSPLSRVQREMIAVVVSAENECHY